MRLVLAILLLSLPTSALAEDSSLQQRLELARKMHEINPARDQVNAALEQIAKTKPPAAREKFVSKMSEVLNYKAIEKVSIDAMVETYTAEELQAMVNYYSSAEGQSIKEKYPDYQAQVTPEIIRMMDVAVMRMRTGAQ